MKYVYLFEEGNQNMKNLLGGKGANLAEMTSLNLPVPKGFTVTTEVCNKYYQNGQILDESIKQEILGTLQKLEEITGKKLGDPLKPLLVSVRSGARVSMPGMMDTVLNLGLNDTIVDAFSKTIEDPRFIYDSYRRLIQMFADVVKGYPKNDFENILDEIKREKKVHFDTDLTAEDMRSVVDRFKKVYKNLASADFPQDPIDQIIQAITAVFRSWNTERAIVYRKLNEIPSDWGTAVNVQEMVYGNKGQNCGTGVAFTRNPSTGEKGLYGEYLMNAQGEDVVAGIRTPKPIQTLQENFKDIYEQFEKIAKKLEEHYKDMQDMEFTIEDGKLFMLQTRNGKRTASAALKIAVDMVEEGMITREEALCRVDPDQLEQLLHPMFIKESLEKGKIIATGLAASPGAGTGKIYFSALDVKNAKKRGEKAILVRTETSPEDIEGMIDSEGILTNRGGMTSHAAVVARGMGRCCICGCEEMQIDEQYKKLQTKDGSIYHEGDFISLDGSTGCVYDGQIETESPQITGTFETFMKWADEVKKLGVRANADTPKDAIQAKKFGAEGIGLCRTEHMFFDENRIFHFRKMIMADTSSKRDAALEEILPYQREDFIGLFEAMEGHPVIIRYLDPPLHEFLPHTEEEMKILADSLEMSLDNIKNRILSLKEFNPMMGHRGCRLAITYPSIAKMQTRAIIEAAISVKQRGISVYPEIMIPLVGDLKEFTFLKKIIVEEIEKIFIEKNEKVAYKIGTMIEVPRGAILADEIAKESEFFSFGTNDLTQMTYGFSRDDAGKFLHDYYTKGIFNDDPFTKIDQNGVGKLMKVAIALAKDVNAKIELGICGEHGGEISSIIFCHSIGLDYVSCSPYRVPIARLAAARASLMGM